MRGIWALWTAEFEIRESDFVAWKSCVFDKTFISGGVGLGFTRLTLHGMGFRIQGVWGSGSLSELNEVYNGPGLTKMR